VYQRYSQQLSQSKYTEHFILGASDKSRDAVILYPMVIVYYS